MVKNLEADGCSQKLGLFPDLIFCYYLASK